MDRPRLFISHSSKDTALTTSVVEALKGPAGAHPGFDVLVDMDSLQAGEEWPNQLHAMMAYAHAGLLLFTPAAMARPDWIRKETYILTWRRSLDPSFRLYYAFLDGVTQTDLSARGFDPAHLNLIQRLAGTTATDIATEVRSFPGVKLASTPLEQLTLALSQHLQLTPAALEQIAAALEAPPVPWIVGNNIDARVGQIAACLLAGQLGEVESLKSLINLLKALGIREESLRIVMRWVGPHWIRPEVAGRLAALTTELPQSAMGMGVLAAINGQCVMEYTAKMFVYKVLPFAFQCRVAQLENAGIAPTADYFTQQICNWLREDDRNRPASDRVGYAKDDARLVQELADEDPFLFVPLRPPDRDTVQELQRRFPKVVFLLWTGNELTPLGYDLPVVSLEVNQQRELLEYKDWRSALKSIGA